MENRISEVITPDKQVEVMKAIEGVQTALPFLLKLQEDERKHMLLVDDGRKPFLEKAFEYATINPLLNPGPGLIDEALKDFEMFKGLATFETQLASVLEMITDTKRVAGAEAYETARFVYMKAKMELKMGKPGMQAIVDQLGKLFEQANTPKPPAAAPEMPII